MEKKNKLNPKNQEYVTGGHSGYTGGKQCPNCGQNAMTYMPSILTPEGDSYAVYHCTNCGHDEYIKQ